MKMSLERLFQTLSDPTRLRSLVLLSREGELCVCELTHALAEIQPKVSRHLALMREAGLVTGRREGQWVYYRLHPDLPPWVLQVIAAAREGAEDEEPFHMDRARLKGMPNRPDSRCCA
ncbi:MAG: metalloregulator ArsR/SmtB family transcription factor [Gammaproteobacteria bacterium]